MEHYSGCLVCGEELAYSTQETTKACIICDADFFSNVSCGKGHYVCDSCHNKEAVGSITAVCLESGKEVVEDPMELTHRLLSLPSVKMHGPEHHYLVPAVLLTTMSHAMESAEKLPGWLELAKERSAKVPGGFCGSHGNCGACVGTGTALSIITESSPLAGESWGAINRLTGECLLLVSDHGGSRCCKRDSFIAIHHSLQSMNRRFETRVMVPDDIQCRYSDNNKQCLGTKCQFFQAVKS